MPLQRGAGRTETGSWRKNSSPRCCGHRAFDGEKLAEGIVDWVEMETPSDRPDLIDRMFDRVESAFDGLPVEIRRLRRATAAAARW